VVGETKKEADMEGLFDFLNFRSFVSPGILKVTYFTGAFVVPVLIGLFLRKAGRKYPWLSGIPAGKGYNTLNTEGKVRLIAFFAVLVVVTEILWRMVIEYLIAYLQIRDALILLLGR
jgi:hypothetical protein